ncbi:MAG: flagellar hook-associated protein FlgK [Pseudomonadota bacterium]
MSLSSSLGVSLSGLQNSQTALQITSGNIANADTDGYSRKVHNQSAAIGQDVTFGVRIERATRELNQLVQAQWQGSKADRAYASEMQNYLSRVDTSFGQPGSPLGIDTMFSELVAGLESLATTPENYAAQLDVLGKAEEFSGQLRALSAEIQGMRLEAEEGIAAAVKSVNDDLDLIRDLNKQIVAFGAKGPPPDLLDQRDLAINRISENMDIRVNYKTDGGVAISTQSGLSLFDVQEVQLVFDERAAMSAQAVYNSDPAQSGVGNFIVRGVNGADTNIFEGNLLRSGRIHALQTLRDDQLVEAQRQLDELASMVALAASSVTEVGTAVTVGPQNGFEVDLTGLQPGNPIELTIDNAGTRQVFSIVAVTDPGLLPLDPDATPRTDDTVIGVDISGGIPAAIAAMGAALGGSFSTSNPAGNTLRVLSNSGAVTIESLNSDITRTGLTDEGLGLPMFVDGKRQLAYTNSLEDGGQLAGFASRIEVGAALKDDPSRLVIHETIPATTAPGDPARVNAILTRFTEAQFAVSPDTGVGTVTQSYDGSVGGFIGQLLSFQGAQAARANNLNEVEEIRYTAIETRLSESADVNIDAEMANLIELQNAYSANARVMTIVQEMMNELLRVI